MLQDSPDWAALSCWTATIDRFLSREQYDEEVARGAVEAFRTQFPQAAAVCCRLESCGKTAVSVWAADEAAIADWRRRFASFKEEPIPGSQDWARMPVQECGQAWIVMAAPFAGRGRCWGNAKFAFGASETEAALAAAQRHLNVLSAIVALCVAASEANRRASQLQEERQSFMDTVTVGEAMVSLMHGLNNSLNTLMLQAAVTQLKVDDQLRQEIGQIRKEGSAIAARMRPLMQFREQRRLKKVVTDLHQAIEEFALDPSENAASLKRQLEATRSKVVAHSGDLKRMLHYLLGVIAPAAGSPCRLRTENTNAELHLIIERDHGKALPYGDSGSPFDPFVNPFGSGNAMAELALDSLLRLVGASMRCYTAADGHTSSVVVWSEPTA